MTSLIHLARLLARLPFLYFRAKQSSSWRANTRRCFKVAKYLEALRRFKKKYMRHSNKNKYRKLGLTNSLDCDLSK